MSLFLAWLLYSFIGSILSYYFMYTWGWGDAGHNEPTLFWGDPSDTWHIRRRICFYIIAIWSCTFNPIGLLLLAIYGRRIFQYGVFQASPRTYTRWYK